MSVQPRTARPSSHLGGCAGFWLWALVGAGLVFGFISLGILALIPAVAFAVVLTRWSRWGDRPVQLGVVAGAALPLLLVAALQWDAWHHRASGDNTPNPYDWGGVGICLLVVGIVAYAVWVRRGS